MNHWLSGCMLTLLLPMGSRIGGAVISMRAPNAHHVDIGLSLARLRRMIGKRGRSASGPPPAVPAGQAIQCELSAVSRHDMEVSMIRVTILRQREPGKRFDHAYYAGKHYESGAAEGSGMLRCTKLTI